MKLRIATDEPTSHGFGAGLGSDPQPMMCSHRHADLELNFVYSGRLTYFMSGRTVVVPEQTLAVFWAGLPHQVLSTAPNTSFMWLHVPFETVLRWSLGNEFMERLLEGGLILDHEGLPRDAELTQGWLEDLRQREHGLDTAIELEVEARVRRLVRSQRYVLRAPSTDEQRRRQVTAMASFLAARYREEVQIKDVAKAANVSPNYAMTLFRRECGLSISQYLTRLRVADAQVELLCTDKTVLTIALESGFGSLAGFYAAFQKECGVAPGEYRRKHSSEYAGDVRPALDARVVAP